MKNSHRWVWISALGFAACAGTPKVQMPASLPETQQSVESARLATAELKSQSTQGNLNFEQMPNSTLVTFRFEGLQPKGSYRIYIQSGDVCHQPEMETASPLVLLRANRQGIAENTFRTEDYSVSGAQSVLGSSIVLARINPQTSKPTLLACALVRAGSSAMTGSESSE